MANKRPAIDERPNSRQVITKPSRHHLYGVSSVFKCASGGLKFSAPQASASDFAFVVVVTFAGMMPWAIKVNPPPACFLSDALACGV